MTFREMIRSESGDSQLVTLGLILALVVVVAIAALTRLGQRVTNVLSRVANAI